MLEALELSEKAHKLIEEEKYEDALQLLDKAEKTEPMCIRIYMERSGALALQDRIDEALEQLDKAQMIDRKDAEVYYLKGNIFMLRHEIEKALEIYLKAESLDFSSPFMMNNIAHCYQEQHQYDQAVEYEQKAEALRPTWLEPWIAHVNLLMLMDKREEAEDVARKIHGKFPEFTAAYTVLSDVLVLGDKLDEAEELNKEGLEIFGERFEFQIRLARIYNMGEKLEEEEAILEKISAREDLDPDERRETDDMLGMCAMQRQDMEAATAAFERELQTETPDNVCVSARLILMSIYKLSNNFEALRRVAASSLETKEADEKLLGAYVMEGIALEGLGREADAKAIYEAAVRKYRILSIANRDRLDTHQYRIYCYIGLKDYDRAMEELEYVEKLTGETDITLTFRAQILRATGDEKGAEEAEAKLNGEAGDQQ